MLSLRPLLFSVATRSTLSCSWRTTLFFVPPLKNTLCHRSKKNISCYCVEPKKKNGVFPVVSDRQSSSCYPKDSPFSGLEDALMSYLVGKRRATDIAHMVWKQVVQKGDTVIDATCGNGFDTLAMLNLVADDSNDGYVYALDIQEDALNNTSLLLEKSLNSNEKQLVKIFNICHSKMENVVPRNASVRLVAFNLGYLPGGDREIITVSETTSLALEAAKRILMPGGLISIVVYVGHPGGRIVPLLSFQNTLMLASKLSSQNTLMLASKSVFISIFWSEELEAVESFATKLCVENWICCKLQMLNRPFGPIPIFLYRR